MSKLSNTNRLLYAVFFLSGISGLIYETVWLRVLSRILGSTVQATSITISAFMLGLTLGSYYLSKITEKVRNKIKLYAKLEIAIALTAVAIYLLFNELVPIYRLVFDLVGSNIILFRVIQTILLFVLMAIPTFFMGATLPILSAGILSGDANFTKTVGFLYGLNTFGAMFGVFLSAFITIGSIGELNTVLIGCVFNLLAGTVFLLVNKTYTAQQSAAALQHSAPDTPLITDYSSKIRSLVLNTYSAIGFISFALEVVWVRLFQLSLGTAIYSFSIVMIIYLFGSAMGSYTCSKIYTRLKSPVETLGLLLIGLGFYIVIGVFLFSQSLPLNVSAPLNKFSFALLFKIVSPPLIIFPITFVLGFIFPIVSRVYVQAKEKTGSGIGRLYAANTIGCILGALFCGYVFIPMLGTRNTMLFLSCCGWITGAVVLFKGGNILSGVLKKVAAFSMAGLILVSIFTAPDPFLSSFSRYISNNHEQIWYNKECSDATLSVCGVSATDPAAKGLFINGISMTILCVETKVMAHLPLLLQPDPKNMLIVCYGMGTCLRSAATHPDVNIDVVELIKEEFEVGHFFHSNASEVLANKRVRHFADDGRNFLLMHDKKYDVISIDPAPPLYSAGTVNLYSKDFFTICRQRLTDNGILCLWIPPDSPAEIKMIMKGFQSVFPNTYVYSGITFKGFYMMGYMNYSPPDSARFDSAAKNAAIMADLNEWNGSDTLTPLQLLKLKIMNPSQLSQFLQGVNEVSDNYPYTEFPLWRRVFSPKLNALLTGGNYNSN
jgi:spermidine synthase